MWACVMRQFIRHPIEIPLEYQLLDPPSDLGVTDMKNVSVGGLCFSTGKRLTPGQRIQISIGVCEPSFQTVGEVMWCRTHEEGFETGISFNDNKQAYAVRMVEQVCHIHQYRQQVLADEQRELSVAEAAQEWIARYAADFPAWDELSQEDKH